MDGFPEAKSVLPKTGRFSDKSGELLPKVETQSGRFSGASGHTG